MARNFRSRAAYQRWLAYGHIHGDFARVPGYQRVSIRGKPHHVVHSHRVGLAAASMATRRRVARMGGRAHHRRR